MSINLHALVAPAISILNTPIPGSWLAASGYTTAGDGARAETYASPVMADVQVQALAGTELELVDGLNIQGEKRAFFMNGNVRGQDRVTKAGGDLIKFAATADVPASIQDSTWLVIMVLETWDGPGWCRFAGVRQTDAP